MVYLGNKGKIKHMSVKDKFEYVKRYKVFLENIKPR